MRALRLLLALFAGVAMAGGCGLSGRRADPATFFALSATEAPDGHPPAGSWEVALGLGPVTIPGYLDRPQLVTRVGTNELRLAEVARWAEPLRESVVRVLQQDVVAASGARRVALYPWAAAAPVDLAVAVDVLRFEPGAGDAVELVARWSVRDAVHGGVLAVRESRVVERVYGAGTGGQVAALSRALGVLAREIAATAREVARP